MSLRSRFRSFCRNLVRRDQVDEALDEELTSYTRMLADEKERAGLERSEAHRAALLEIGGVTQVRENVRRARAGAALDTLRTDLRYAIRSLARSPVFTVTAVLCLALGIGTNAGVFSLVDTILHPRFGFAASEDLVVLRSSRPTHGIPTQDVSYPDFTAWRDQATTFDGMAAQASLSVTLAAPQGSIQAVAAAVSWQLFTVLGTRPAIGRDFRADDDRPGAPGMALLGHDIWTDQFGADSAIIGTTIGINDRQHTVIGVMPPRFRFPENTALWIPLAPIADENARGSRSLGVFARLAPGVSQERATLELQAIAARLAAAYPATNTAWTARLVPLTEYLGSEEGLLSALAMMGAVTFLLLIACTNVANLMLARGSARRREIAIRFALGASRGRTIRLLLVESMTLAALSGILGIGVASVSLRLLDAALPAASVPYYIDWQIDTSALLYITSIALGTAIAFGLVPALLVSGGDLQDPLKEGQRSTGIGRRPARFRNSLVVLEVALSLILVVGATLFARTLKNLANADPGFETASLLSLRVNLPGPRYADASSRTRIVDELVTRMEALPGVASAAATSTGYVGGFYGGGTVEGANGPAYDIRWTSVTPHWFLTLNIPILQGRGFTPSEGQDRAQVAIVNQSMANRVWPNENPVGHRFRFVEDSALPWLTVVGVARDVHGVRPRARQQALVFLPYPYATPRTVSILVRTATSEPLAGVPGIRRAVRESDPALPIFEIQTMEELRRLAYAETTVLGGIFSVFGFIALSLAAIGVYGVIAYGVTQRTHEIGVRMALGARRVDVLGMFVGQGLRLATLGLVIGLAGTFALTRVLRGMLFGVSTTDPVSFTVGAVLLLLVAVAATWAPAWRAAHRDPARILRAE